MTKIGIFEIVIDLKYMGMQNFCRNNFYFLILKYNFNQTKIVCYITGRTFITRCIKNITNS